ncbi:MAG: cation diffusion facilitator family transporter [Bacilli bacterium]
MKDNKVIRVLIIISILNLLSFTIKLLVGLNINSSAVVADSFHSLSDLLANFVGIFALFLAFKPADDTHLYGHEKIENLASLIISFVLMYTGGRVIYNFVTSINSTSTVTISLGSILIIASTLIINIIVVIYETRKGKKLKSSFLVSDAKHTLSDIYITLGVLINMIMIKLGAPGLIDLIISIFIGVIIIKAGLEIFFKSVSVLIDSSIIDQVELEEFIEKINDVKEVHFLKTRGNEVNVYVEAHLMFDAKMSVYNAHEICNNIEKKVKEKYNYNFHFNFHIEPYVDKFKIKD